MRTLQVTEINHGHRSIGGAARRSSGVSIELLAGGFEGMDAEGNNFSGDRMMSVRGDVEFLRLAFPERR